MVAGLALCFVGFKVLVMEVGFALLVLFLHQLYIQLTQIFLHHQVLLLELQDVLLEVAVGRLQPLCRLLLGHCRSASIVVVYRIGQIDKAALSHALL